MKTLVLAVTILFSSLTHLANASDTLNMHSILEESVTFENGSLGLIKNQPEFVKISFRINEEGAIEVLEINYSNEAVKEQLIQQLNAIQVHGSVDAEEIYHYNFSFHKE
ncbi:MAG: hypothetical protein P1U56_26030 [Saprospiraceae bacterium]|nr:hypothetical protein [Saprospiraceae bacterium]